MKRILVSILFAAMCLIPVLAQGEITDFAKTADSLYSKKDYCNALEAYEKAMQVKELADYAMYRAAQSACQCGKPQIALKYAVEAFKNYKDFQGYDYFATGDPLNTCFRNTPEWQNILAGMNAGYKAFKARQEKFLASINDQNARLNYSTEQDKSFAVSLDKMNAAKLATYLQNYKAYQTPPQTDHWALYHLKVENFGEVPFLVYVPKDYKPSEAKPLFVYLHGGVKRLEKFESDSNPTEYAEGILGQLAKLNTFIIYPFARKDFNWLFHPQAFEAITREIAYTKTLYNINDNKVYIGGHSNGATGTLWYALNNRTNYAGFYGFSISPVLNLGQSFYANLNNEQKFITLNGTKDTTFPYEEVSAVYEKAKPLNPNWILQPVKDGTHTFITNSPKEIEQVFTDLLKETRNPFPKTITQQTDNNDSDQNFWLKITRTNPSISNADAHQKSADIKAVYADNSFNITSSGASEIKLLIPYGMIDYKKKLTVNVNDKVLFDKKITLDKQTLVDDFTKSRDRKFLVGNEITLAVGE